MADGCRIRTLPRRFRFRLHRQRHMDAVGGGRKLSEHPDRHDGRFGEHTKVVHDAKPLERSYRGLHVLQAAQRPDGAARNPAPNMWFLPAIHQLVGIYVAGGSQVAAMQPYYWSSTFLGEAASMQKSYRIGKNGLVEAPPLTPPSGQPEKAAVRGCRIPPPVELAPKTSRQQTKAQ